VPPFRLLVKSQRGFDLAGYPRTWLAAAPKAKCNIKLEVNVDPQSVL
jgi:primosomal protein N' (replication factor Y)